MTDAENQSPEHDADAKDEAVEIARLESELDAARDKMLRAMAETENVRRRLEREKDDVARYAISRFAGDLLPVADNLQRALDSVPATAREGSDLLAKLVDGVGATGRALSSALEKNGLRQFDPMGQVFDPNLHEVLFELETPEKPAGTVVQVLETGYKIGDRLLRPARVGVAKGAPKT